MAYACFISYRRPESDIETKIIAELHAMLRGYLGLLYGPRSVFLDDTRLSGGDFLEIALARALHQSVCMVMVYKAWYFDCAHPYCAREYRAMLELEKQRLALLPEAERQHGLIIPIALTCGNTLYIPSEIKQRLFATIDVFGLRNYRLESCVSSKAAIQKVAQHIIDRCTQLGNLIPDSLQDDPTFTLPAEQDLTGWLCEMAGAGLPLPFRT